MTGKIPAHKLPHGHDPHDSGSSKGIDSGMKRVKFTSYWLIVFMFLIIAVGFSVTSVLSFLVTKQYVTRSEITHTLPLISDNIYSSIKEDLIDPINISSLMSNDTFLINWVNEGEEDLNAITEYLRYIKEEYGYTSAFFVSDQTRNYYYYDGILKQISPEDAHDIWYCLLYTSPSPRD